MVKKGNKSQKLTKNIKKKLTIELFGIIMDINSAKKAEIKFGIVDVVTMPDVLEGVF